jgi:hypothetical protein
MCTKQCYYVEVSHELLLAKVDIVAWIQHVPVLCIAAIFCFCLKLLDSICISRITNSIPMHVDTININMKVNSLEPYNDNVSDIGIRNLNDDLNDFLALVPLDKIIAILLDYLANDAQVQELVLYLQSEEFHKIVRTVEELEEFKQVSIIAHTCVSESLMRNRKCSVQI